MPRPTLPFLRTAGPSLSVKLSAPKGLLGRWLSLSTTGIRLPAPPTGTLPQADVRLAQTHEAMSVTGP